MAHADVVQLREQIAALEGSAKLRVVESRGMLCSSKELGLADATAGILELAEDAPLGVLLPAGLGLKIDNADVGRAGFVRCLPRGCYAEVVMDDTLVGKLRTGQTATFFIFQTPEEGIGFPIGLKGFGDGYDKLP